MKEDNYHHLNLDSFPSLSDDGSGSSGKQRRRVVQTNKENTLPAHGQHLSSGSVLNFSTTTNGGETSLDTMQNVKTVFDTAIKAVLQPLRRKEIARKTRPRSSGCSIVQSMPPFSSAAARDFSKLVQYG
ncbi:hypothetical protein ACET3Z_020033 [Daucus carota]